MTVPLDRGFKTGIRKALADDVLRRALRTFTELVYELRADAYRGLDFEALRNEVARVKSEAIKHIETLADEFQSRLEERGAKVHRAADGKDVLSIVKDIARRRNAALCVKSKSMASEEIHLNSHLADVMKVVETDLGEWLIQQVDETPSHMVLPAIHFTKERCAEIFSKYLGEKVEPEIGAMVKHARTIMRTHFINADIGISGCNIAVAETGTMCIFSNEGNVRLTATLPPVHIIIFGYEKFVARLKDIVPIVKTLPRSATGQLMTSYLTMISGASETFKDKDGNGTAQKELHVIMLDNGRLKMLADPVFREAGKCIRCTSCLNVCPIYTLLGGHVYGKIYPGAIGSMLTYFFSSLEDAEQIQELCISCGLCREFCPAKIDIPNLTLELRRRVRDKIRLPLPERLVLDNVLPSKLLFSAGMRTAAVASLPLTKKGSEGKKYIRALPFGFKKYTQGRSVPAIYASPFRDRFKKIKQNVAGNEKGTVAFFSGCAIEWLYPGIGEAVIKVLNHFGYRVAYPEQKCCGAPAIFSGNRKSGLTLATDNIEKMNNDGWMYIVSACPTCTHVIKDLWKGVIDTHTEFYPAAEKIADKTIDFVKLVHDFSRDEDKTMFTKTVEPCKVTYHFPCHLVRSMGIKEEPVEVLQSLPGVEYVEMKEAERCCGFGGTYSMKFPAISRELLECKMKNIAETGSDIVITDCPGCLFNLAGGLDNADSPTRAMHMAELLVRFIEEG